MKADSTGRHITFWTSFSFIVASMIGTGVFTSLGFQLADIQSIFSLLMLWLIGGVVAIAGALTYAELGTVFPRSGGEYHILSSIIHPSVGFAAGIISATVGFTAPAVLAAIALGDYLSAVLPFFNKTYTAFFVIIGLHYLHMSSVSNGIYFQDISTGLKVGLIVLFIGFGFFIEQPQSISLMPNIGDVSIIFSPSFAIGLVWVSYAYTGWNSSIYIAGEIINPDANISKVMLLATTFVMILYVLLNYIFLYSTPIELMVGHIDIGYVSGLHIFGDFGGAIMSLGISIILLSTVSSYIYIGPRIIQVMGEDYLFLSVLKHKNSKDIPINAFWIQLLLSIVLILTSSFKQILMYTGVSLIITTTLTVFSLFILRYKKPGILRPYKVIGYPIVPFIFLIVNLWILYFSFMHSMAETLVGIYLVVGSIVGFFIISWLRK